MAKRKRILSPADGDKLSLKEKNIYLAVMGIILIAQMIFCYMLGLWAHDNIPH